MAELPMDFIVEILLRLPVASLLRFRCVSKTWRNLIRSPNFVESHLNLSKKAQPLLFCQDRSCANHFELDTYFAPNFELETAASWYDYPISMGYGPYGVVGHCNGLLCCKTNDICGVILWNPSTRKHIQIPLPQQRFMGRFWGFGHDRDSDDYKVVILVYSKTTMFSWVYSLKSGLWDLWWNHISNFPYFPVGFKNYGVFLNGALHWIVRPLFDWEGPDLICALDLGKMNLSLVPLIDSMSVNIGRLAVLDGCLCATFYDNGSCVFDLWAMKEYGVMESWTRLATCRDDPSYPVRLAAYDDNDDEMRFIIHGYFILTYEFKTERFMTHLHGWSDELTEALVYIPSLVFPECGR